MEFFALGSIRELSGPELVERLRPVRPTLRVLYMSGAEPEAGELVRPRGEDARVLHKPFTVEVLTRTVREVLGPIPAG